MDIVNSLSGFETLRVRFDKEVCFIQIYRPEDNNTINDQLTAELETILERCESEAKIVVLKGLPDCLL